MLRLCVLALVVCAAPVLASERVSCVHAQLALLGFEAGQDNGTIHAELREAARGFYRDRGAEGGFALPFNDRNAGQWCRRLGLTDATLQAAWPSRAAVRIYTDPIAADEKRGLLSAAIGETRKFYREQFDVSLASSFALVATDDLAQLDTLVARALSERGARARKKPFAVERICQGRKVGAAANRDFIAMCWRKPDAYGAVWQAEITPVLTKVLVHEYMHQVQYELANDNPARRLADKSDWVLGPSWMVEGSAEVIEAAYANRLSDDTEGQRLFNMQSSARKARVLLSDLNKTGSVRGGPAYGTARFAAFVLAERYGVQSLFDYFEALGDTGDRDAAFAQVFKLTRAQFEADFETLRRDFGAARDYIDRGN